MCIDSRDGSPDEPAFLMGSAEPHAPTETISTWAAVLGVVRSKSRPIDRLGKRRRERVAGHDHLPTSPQAHFLHVAFLLVKCKGRLFLKCVCGYIIEDANVGCLAQCCITHQVARG